MITEYRPVAWGEGEPVSAQKLATMAANEQYLFESTPKLYYSNGGIKKDRGVKIYATTIVIPSTTATIAHQEVHFGDVFSVGCRPVISATLNMGPSMKYAVVVNGLGQRNPDHRGFRVTVAPVDPANQKIAHTVYVHLIAVGF